MQAGLRQGLLHPVHRLGRGRARRLAATTRAATTRASTSPTRGTTTAWAAPGQWSPVGAAGYAFLESPGNFTDGRDNDEDGITDERRDSGPGTLITGQARSAPRSTRRYNLANFETFYGPLDRTAAYQAGRWWTGDENLSWRGYTDVNGNGQYDAGEPLNDDLGADGLGPESRNYPGRDVGEGDGTPTAGEINFDALDKDESDQIGLTGFSVFDVHKFELTDDEQNWTVFSQALPPLNDVLLEGGRNLGMFFSSGAFPLKAGQTERFSMALLFADRDFADPRQIENTALARKKQTVQQIYNANYRFARPPDKPTLKAVAGDGQVTLTWDALSERSYDPFLREFDFEGYMLYKSTDPNFVDRLLVTDAYGNPVYQRPVAQYDLKNGIRGLHPVPVNGVQFNLGNDSGLRHSFVDRDVTNGQTYYYALVAYDRGLVPRNADGSFPATPTGEVEGISPSITTATIASDIAGNTVTDINTAVVTPRAPAAGYVPPAVQQYTRQTRGTAPVDVGIVSPAAIQGDKAYSIRFTNPDAVWNTGLSPTYGVYRQGETTPAVQGTITPGLNEISTDDGFSLTITAPEAIVVPDSSVKLLNAGNTNYRPVVRPGTVTPVVTAARFIPFPDDYEVRFVGGAPDTSLRLAFGQAIAPLPFYVQNLTENRRQRVILVEDVDSLRNGRYDNGDLIVLVDGETPGAKPELTGGKWRAGWAFRLAPPDPVIDVGVKPIAPPTGTVLRFRTVRPFATGDQISLKFSAPSLDQARARRAMDSVYVVPNPYVGSSRFEPSNPYINGRGARRLMFMGLPPQATVRIYTITGELVQTLRKDDGVDNGQLAWDLTTRDGMNVSYGIYLFHVDAPGVGETVGRFAVIK